MKKFLVKKLIFGENTTFNKKKQNIQTENKKTNKYEEEDFFYKNSNENLYYRNEIALWRAVILQCFVDLQNNSKKKIANTYRIKALMWFNLKNPDFLTVCDYAGLDPNYVYEKSRKIKEKNKFFL